MNDAERLAQIRNLVDSVAAGLEGLANQNNQVNANRRTLRNDAQKLRGEAAWLSDLVERQARQIAAVEATCDALEADGERDRQSQWHEKAAAASGIIEAVEAVRAVLDAAPASEVADVAEAEKAGGG